MDWPEINTLACSIESSSLSHGAVRSGDCLAHGSVTTNHATTDANADGSSSAYDVTANDSAATYDVADDVTTHDVTAYPHSTSSASYESNEPVQNACWCYGL